MLQKVTLKIAAWIIQQFLIKGAYLQAIWWFSLLSAAHSLPGSWKSNSVAFGSHFSNSKDWPLRSCNMICYPVHGFQSVLEGIASVPLCLRAWLILRLVSVVVWFLSSLELLVSFRHLKLSSLAWLKVEETAVSGFTPFRGIKFGPRWSRADKLTVISSETQQCHEVPRKT